MMTDAEREELLYFQMRVDEVKIWAKAKKDFWDKWGDSRNKNHKGRREILEQMFEDISWLNEPTIR